MKTITTYFMALALLCFACDNDDDPPQNPIDQLPLITQTGAGTFGCLVNGEPFVDTSGNFNCFYQFVDGGYFFNIRGRNEDDDPRSIILATNRYELSEGVTVILKENVEGNAWAGIRFEAPDNSTLFSETNSDLNGELSITKFDFESNIVSGIFSFEIRNPVTNEITQITNGRFDSFFNQ